MAQMIEENNLLDNHPNANVEMQEFQDASEEHPSTQQLRFQNQMNMQLFGNQPAT